MQRHLPTGEDSDWAIRMERSALVDLENVWSLLLGEVDGHVQIQRIANVAVTSSL